MGLVTLELKSNISRTDYYQEFSLFSSSFKQVASSSYTNPNITVHVAPVQAGNVLGPSEVTFRPCPKLALLL